MLLFSLSSTYSISPVFATVSYVICPAGLSENLLAEFPFLKKLIKPFTCIEPLTSNNIFGPVKTGTLVPPAFPGSIGGPRGSIKLNSLGTPPI